MPVGPKMGEKLSMDVMVVRLLFFLTREVTQFEVQICPFNIQSMSCNAQMRTFASVTKWLNYLAQDLSI